MFLRIISLTVLTILSLALFGCSGGNQVPVTPDTVGANLDAGEPYDGSHHLWGLWEVSVNEDRTSVEITPARFSTGHFNVTHLLEYSPCMNCLRIVQVVPSGANYLEVTIELRHPYPGMDTFTGFDVRGIAIFNGTALFPSSGLTYSNNEFGEGELLNPDGYTTLYNLGTEGHGMGGYLQGKMASDPPGDAELNGYKCFMTDENRRYFASGDVIQVVYNIEPPPWGAFVFGYAVDANWAPPNPFNNPAVPDDFPMKANSPEAYMISASVIDLSANLNDTGTITVDVWDHQGIGTISSVSVEAPEIWGGKLDVPLLGDMGDYVRFEGTVMNAAEVDIGDYKALVSVRDVKADTAPEWIDLTAYKIFDIHVDPEQTEPGIYVDGDYPGNDAGLPEFGTPEAPFNTIVEGVIASGPGGLMYMSIRFRMARGIWKGL